MTSKTNNAKGKNEHLSPFRPDRPYRMRHCRRSAFDRGSSFVKKKRKTWTAKSAYTLVDLLMSSPTEPFPAELLSKHIETILSALRSIESGEKPSTADWELCADAANLTETLVMHNVFADESGVLQDAIDALARAGVRSLKGGVIRLDGPGLVVVRSLIETYCELIPQVPAQQMIRAHRATAKRNQEIYSGKKKPHDKQVVSL